MTAQRGKSQVQRTAAAFVFFAALVPVSANAQSDAAKPAADSIRGQGYPARPVRLVVPYPPGGAADNVARVVSQKLTQSLGQQVLVDNRAGAAGIIGSEFVAKSAPDGYTLLVAASSHAVNPALRKLPFDTVKDFAPATMIWISPNLLVTHPSLPVHSVSDLIKLAKAHPGQINYASAGVGSAPHMAGELFSYLSKVNLTHVPYKGGGPALTDLMGGQVQLSFLNIATSLAYLKSGKINTIAVTSMKRSRSAPQLPTIAESGVPGYDLYEWNALFAPAGTSGQIIAQLNSELAKLVAAPDVQERLFQLGAEAALGGPEQLDNYVRNEIAKWTRIVKDMGIKGD